MVPVQEANSDNLCFFFVVVVVFNNWMLSVLIRIASMRRF